MISCRVYDLLKINILSILQDFVCIDICWCIKLGFILNKIISLLVAASSTWHLLEWICCNEFVSIDFFFDLNILLIWSLCWLYYDGFLWSHWNFTCPCWITNNLRKFLLLVVSEHWFILLKSHVGIVLINFWSKTLLLNLLTEGIKVSDFVISSILSKACFWLNHQRAASKSSIQNTANLSG